MIRAHHRHALNAIREHFERCGQPLPRVHLNACHDDLPGFAANLARTAHAAKYDPHLITVELICCTSHVRSLEILQEQGFTLALDDIGREHFGRLTRLPMFSVVKTDRELIHHPERLHALTQQHLDAGQQVIIEGVVSDEDAALARGVQATATQGYRHYPPVPVLESDPHLLHQPT